MPNWCDFDIAVKGDKKELDILYGKINLCKARAKVNHNWDLFELFIEHGYKKEEILKDRFPYIGGSIDQVNEPTYHEELKCWYMYIYNTTRWSPMIEGFNKILSENYRSLSAVYRAEEPGCDIYINTDSSGTFFDDRYYIYDDENGSEYFASSTAFINYMSSQYSTTITTTKFLALDDDCAIRIKDGRQIWFHRFVEN